MKRRFAAIALFAAMGLATQAWAHDHGRHDHTRDYGYGNSRGYGYRQDDEYRREYGREYGYRCDDDYPRTYAYPHYDGYSSRYRYRHSDRDDYDDYDDDFGFRSGFSLLFSLPLHY